MCNFNPYWPGLCFILFLTNTERFDHNLRPVSKLVPSQEVTFFLIMRDWQLLTLQNWTILPLFKQNLLWDRAVNEHAVRFQPCLCLPPCYFAALSVRKSWPLDSFVVTQGPEQGVLLYTSESVKYQSLFGMNTKLLLY